MRDTENRNTAKCKTDKIRKMTEKNKIRKKTKKEIKNNNNNNENQNSEKTEIRRKTVSRSE